MPESGATAFEHVAVLALHALSLPLVIAAIVPATVIAATVPATVRATVIAATVPATGVPTDGPRLTAARGDDSTDAPRVTVSLNRGWRFKQAAALSGVEQAQFDDSDWEQVSTPHTWNRLGN